MFVAYTFYLFIFALLSAFFSHFLSTNLFLLPIFKIKMNGQIFKEVQSSQYSEDCREIHNSIHNQVSLIKILLRLLGMDPEKTLGGSGD